MDILSGDISSLVFQRITRDDLGKFLLDGQMLSVIVELVASKALVRLPVKKGFAWPP